MVTRVIKRDGSEEEFQEEKLKSSIERSAKEAGYPENEVSKIVEEISSLVLDSIKDLDTVDTASLRSLILNELDKKYPEVASSWRKYDRETKGLET